MLSRPETLAPVLLGLSTGEDQFSTFIRTGRGTRHVRAGVGCRFAGGGAKRERLSTQTFPRKRKCCVDAFSTRRRSTSLRDLAGLRAEDLRGDWRLRRVGRKTADLDNSVTLPDLKRRLG
jgi:hypothetical protein